MNEQTDRQTNGLVGYCYCRGLKRRTLILRYTVLHRHIVIQCCAYIDKSIVAILTVKNRRFECRYISWGDRMCVCVCVCVCVCFIMWV